MDSYSLTLPLPPSANNYWRTAVIKGKPLVHTTKEAKEYKRMVHFLCLKEGVRKPIVGRVFLDVAYYPGRPKDWERRAKKDPNWDLGIQCMDLDNILKVMIDSLKDVAFGDDKWVHGIYERRYMPDEKGARLEVTIYPLDMHKG